MAGAAAALADAFLPQRSRRDAAHPRRRRRGVILLLWTWLKATEQEIKKTLGRCWTRHSYRGGKCAANYYHPPSAITAVSLTNHDAAWPSGDRCCEYVATNWGAFQAIGSLSKHSKLFTR